MTPIDCSHPGGFSAAWGEVHAGQAKGFATTLQGRGLAPRPDGKPTMIKHLLKSLLSRRVPGQLVIQMTDHCNAGCPQCGMRVSAPFSRTTLAVDEIKRIIDAAAARGVQAISFTGGEPFLFLDALVELLRHAGAAGVAFTRTGTNGFLFQGADKPSFLGRVSRIAERLAATPLRNLWISMDSAEPGVHERMRGFKGVVRGIERALPVFHDHGIYPSVNLGLNRNMGGALTRRLLAHPHAEDPERVYQIFCDAVRRFYRSVIDLGFTLVNTCYPMSIDLQQMQAGLSAVYGATATGDIVRFSQLEKAQLYRALMDTIPQFRSKIRIFSPLCAVYALHRHYANDGEAGYPCRGGRDFFYIDAKDGHTYPCGYRGNEDLGRFWQPAPSPEAGKTDCRRCDWECFRDPSELFGPLDQALSHPHELGWKLLRYPRFFNFWRQDLRYYAACDFFDGRKAPRTAALSRFS